MSKKTKWQFVFARNRLPMDHELETKVYSAGTIQSACNKMVSFLERIQLGLPLEESVWLDDEVRVNGKDVYIGHLRGHKIVEFL